MISTVTTTTTTIVTTQAILIYLCFYLLIGFLYHIFKTREYKESIKASIVIGVIIGLITGILSSSHIIMIFLVVLNGIFFVFIGGLIAVGIKKIYNRRKS
jgi:uncharacterized membrane protein